MQEGQCQKLQILKERLGKLQMQGKITRQQEKQIIDHIRESMKYGDTELDSHLQCSDEELI